MVVRRAHCRRKCCWRPMDKGSRLRGNDKTRPSSSLPRALLSKARGASPRRRESILLHLGLQCFT